MMHFRVVYDISSGSYQWIFPVMGLFFVFISTCLIVMARAFYRTKQDATVLDSSPQRLFYNLNHPINRNAFIRIPWFILVFASIFTITTFLATFGTYKKFRRIYKEKKYSVLVGEVESLIDKGKDNGEDFLVVDGKKFLISNYQIDNSFRGIGTYKKIVKEGDWVRIYYHKDVIIRLEIGEE